MVKWLPPHGFTAKIHHIDAQVGGSYKMSFTNFSTKHAHTFGGTYLEMKPNELLQYNDKFDDSMPGEMKVTVTFRKVACGTELNVTQENLPEQIPVEMCYLGWQQSLELMTKLVEPDIPDGS